MERASDGASLCIANVFCDLIAERSFAECGKALSERIQAGAGAGKLSPEGIDVTEKMLVNQG